MTMNQIKHFWNQRAKQGELSDQEVTHRDIWQRWLEVETIKKFLKPSDRALDVGCGNGYTTKLIVPLVNAVVGMDYSEEMITRAKADPELRQENLRSSVSFAVGDVLALKPSAFGGFDVVISERCLINLGSWEDQKLAIANIAAVLKPGGRFLFIEGSKQGRTRLNQLRKSLGLEAMPPVWHNLDFDENELMTFLGRDFDVEHQLHFGVYDFLSRVVHPLLAAPEPPQYDSKINQMAARLALTSQEFGSISRVLFSVLRRKA